MWRAGQQHTQPPLGCIGQLRVPGAGLTNHGCAADHWERVSSFRHGAGGQRVRLLHIGEPGRASAPLWVFSTCAGLGGWPPAVTEPAHQRHTLCGVHGAAKAASLPASPNWSPSGT